MVDEGKVLVSTICVIALLFTALSSGTARGPISMQNCQCWPRTWDIRALPKRRSISSSPRSYSPISRTVSRNRLAK